MEKLPIGPIKSRPGPTLLKQVITAVEVVEKEKLSIETTRMPAARSARYAAMNR